MTLPFTDAHCHRLPAPDEAPGALACLHVVNATREDDWPTVEALAAAYPAQVIPAYGMHPWFLHTASPGWLDRLEARLQNTRATIGEIGLDRACRTSSLDTQRSALTAQLTIAARLRRPASIHCVKAWRHLADALVTSPLPPCGFLLHAFNGPCDLIACLADKGAFFSYNPRHTMPTHAQNLFSSIPRDRLLVESDRQPLTSKSAGAAPSLPEFCASLASLLDLDLEKLVTLVYQNFLTLFRSCLSATADATAQP